jgi:hypothetical protein
MKRTLLIVVAIILATKGCETSPQKGTPTCHVPPHGVQQCK